MFFCCPCFERPFSLQVDASQVGVGAVLQRDNGEGVVRPVSLFSRKLNSYQLNYSVVEKEALVLIWVLQHFDVYVDWSQPVIVYTDHKLLMFLNSFFIAQIKGFFNGLCFCRLTPLTFNMSEDLKIFAKNLASAYHPQSQGALERFHQTACGLHVMLCKKTRIYRCISIN